MLCYGILENVIEFHSTDELVACYFSLIYITLKWVKDNVNYRIEWSAHCSLMLCNMNCMLNSKCYHEAQKRNPNTKLNLQHHLGGSAEHSI